MNKSRSPLPASASPFDPAPESAQELKDRIATLAYAIWEQCGRTDGHALEHWLRAEQEIAAESAHVQGMRGSSPDSARGESMIPPQGR